MEVNNNGSTTERKKKEHTKQTNERERNMRRIETTREWSKENSRKIHEKEKHDIQPGGNAGNKNIAE